MITITEAKQYLHDNWEKGVSCPCCGQMVKLYRRSLHHSMAVCLIRLFKLTIQKGQNYYHVNEYGADGTRGGDFAKLRYWGLIAEKEKGANDVTKRTSGFWAITKKGNDFVRGLIKISQYIAIFDDKKVDEYGAEISIRECLGQKFDYRELMGEYYMEPTSKQSSLF